MSAEPFVDPRALSPASLALETGQGKWRFFPHLQHLEEQLLPIFLDPDAPKRIAVSIPPQHGKSEYYSGWVCRWAMGKNPDLRAALVSYNQEKAQEYGEKNLEWFERWGRELYGVRISQRRHAARKWGFANADGELYSVGLKGGLTGKKVQLLIVDDPFKDAEECMSPAARERVWRWWGAVANTRLTNDAIVIVIHTRWHEDDLIGRIQAQAQEEGAQEWVFINLPGLAPFESDIPEDERHEWFPDPLGRQPGEALCPELHTAAKLRETQRILTDYFFWALYQGRPRPGKGEIFQEDNLEYWADAELPCVYNPGLACWSYQTHLVRFDEIIQSWDMKFAKLGSTRGAWVVGQVWGRIGARRFLLDQYRSRAGLEETITAVEEMKRRWPMVSAILVERAANGPDVVRRLEETVPGLVLISPVGQGPKPARAAACQYLFLARNILIPRPARYGWVRNWIKEICAFPGGTYADQVDAMSQAMAWFETSAVGSTFFVVPRDGGMVQRLNQLP